jgi:hypothetical protein
MAQSSIKGAVVDEFQNPMAYVNITVHKSNDSTLIKGLITDEDGKFEALLNVESLLLKVSYIGYEKKIIPFEGSKDFGTIVLNPLAENLEGVTIVAQKPFIQRQEDKLIVNVEGSVVSTGNSVMEILEKSPGIVVDQDDNISLSGRNGVRIYLDGKDTRLQGQDLANLLRTLPSSNIEKVEIITNPSAKYETQGNAGIINIVTKKGKLYGTNGSVTISPGHGQYFRWENSLSFNHRTENFNIFGQYSFAKRSQWMKIDIDRAFLDDQGNTDTSYKLRNLFELPIENHSPRIGVDFDASENTSFGILLSGIFNANGSEATNDIRQFNPDGNLLSLQNTLTDVKTNWNQLTGNFNFNHKFKNKSLIDFDFDIARYDNASDEVYDTSFRDAAGQPTSENTLTGDVVGYLDLIGLSFDFELPFENGNKFEAGWKNTWVKTDNDLTYFDIVNGLTSPNEQLTNRFVYNEDIYGAYTTYSINKEKWNVKLGLRGEYTFIQGDQVTTGEVFDSEYFRLFPSLSYNYTLNENNTFGMSLSRRIDRPSYSQLNPFRFFVDTNTFRVGNPLLQPQFTWSAELTYLFKNKYYVAISYGHTTDNLNFGILQDGDNQAVLVQPINIDLMQSYSITASAPVKLANWFQSNINLNASYNQFDGLINGNQLDQSTPVISLSSNHSFSLGNDYQLQLSTFHLFEHYVSITRIDLISAVNIGAQKTFWNGNGTIRLNFNDIFFNQYPVGTTQFGGLNDKFYSYRDSRYATLSFTWRFGKQSVKPAKRRSTGVQEELNRARQQNNN